MNIHFIGIGGIGVSALGRYYLAQGHQVSGSDLESSEITKVLQQEGAKFFIGHDPKCISPQIDRVIYTTAISKDNPELQQAKKLDIKTQTYAQALGELTKEYFTIAVAGTHGKSTTAAMVASILIEAGLDPTVILGTKFKQLEHENCRVGDQVKSPYTNQQHKYLVMEADEWQASFLNYYPELIVLTNIEPEHLDCYKNLNDILKTYQKFISHLPENGVLIANQDDKNIAKLLPACRQAGMAKLLNVKKFSLSQEETKKIKEILKVPGQHNLYNGLAALAAARTLKIPDQISFKALAKFEGVWRRFERVEIKLPRNQTKKTREVTIISDYAHHPTEIKATLKTAQEQFPNRKVWVVFQPHQILRTFYLFEDFIKTFSGFKIDKLIITDIYKVPGREKRKSEVKEISSEKLVERIKKTNNNVKYIPALKEAASFLKENLEGKEVVVIMGAGDVYKLVGNLKTK